MTHNSTLIAHSPKFQSKLVTLDQLRGLPEPLALGPRHKPVSHARLVDGFLAEIASRDMVPVRQQLALGAKGAALFGVIDLQLATTTALVPAGERGISFGFRSSTNETMAIKGVAGTRVFVCDNLSMSGDLIAFSRKSTTGMDLKDVIATGFDKFIVHSRALDLHIERLSGTKVNDIEAKTFIFDIFNTGILPIRLFEDVARFYFKPLDDQTDCQPRTKWGLSNAFTRAMQDLSPTRLFVATVALGRALGMTDRRDIAGAGDVIDAETVTTVE